MNTKYDKIKLGSISTTIFVMCLVFGQSVYSQQPSNSPVKSETEESNQGRLKVKPKVSLKKINWAKEFKVKPDKILDLNNINLDSKINLQTIDFHRIKLEKPMGPGSGGGGNMCSMYIVANTQALLTQLRQGQVFQDDRIRIHLESTIRQVSFYTKSNLELNGFKVDAINYPYEKVILIDPLFCDKISEVSLSAMGLLLHEYLRIAQIDDSEYQISSHFIQDLKNKNYNPRTILKNESMDNMHNNFIEFQSDVTINANTIGYSVQHPKNPYRFKAHISISNAVNQDRIIKQGKLLRIVDLKFINIQLDDPTTCQVKYELILDHNVIRKIVIVKDYEVSRRVGCSETIIHLTVGEFYEIINNLVLVKAQAPLIID